MNSMNLTSDRLLLRAFHKDDAPALHQVLSDEEVNTYLPWLSHQRIEETKEFLQENYLRYNDQENVYRYAICLKENARVIGYVQVGEEESHELGYGLLKEFWHQGIVSEACHLLVDQLKRDKFSYITATHDVLNPRSGGVMKNIGMRYQYSYEECVKVKKQLVVFRLYQMNIYGEHPPYLAYWDKYPNHFIEEDV